jgi:hypothetical protein
MSRDSHRRSVVAPVVALPDDPALTQSDLERDAVRRAGERAFEALTAEDRSLYLELLEDAATDVQQEMLRRGLARGHTLRELHAFADAIRGMDDAGVYAACVLQRQLAHAHSLEERLRAEGDPVLSFALNGRPMRTPLRAAAPAVKLPPGLVVDRRVDPVRRPEPFEEDALEARARPDPNALGDSPDLPSATHPKLGEDLFNHVGRGFDVTYVEQNVDDGKLPLERALNGALEALLLGTPVPVILGPGVGEHRKFGLLLQVETSGGQRTFQLYEPSAQEAVWIHEADLIARAELPLSDKALRRITAIVLPKNRGGILPNALDSSFEG